MSSTKADGETHWRILLAGVLISLVIWVGWLLMGAVWSREKLARAVPKPAASYAQANSATAKPQLPDKQPAPNDQETRERFFTELGQTGDMFGGLNALLTSIAGALVFWAGYMQHLSLRHAKNEQLEERDQRKRQNFETLFFNLLDMSRSVAEQIDGPSGRSPAKRTGPSALDAWARLIWKKNPGVLDPQRTLKRLVRCYLIEVYDQRPSQLGPYFRLLFQTFKHIAEADLTEREKVRYANIARGQISDGAVLLLALNGLTRTGAAFAHYIERFGLLEHLHRRYSQDFGPALRLGYRPRAFLGSRERSLPENAGGADRLLATDYFDEAEAERAQADWNSDFEDGFQEEGGMG